MTYADQAHFNNYDPSSFGWPRKVDLVPFTFDGVNFGQCARAALPVFTALLTELVPLIPGGINFGPHDDWAYSTTDDLDDGSWSFHHFGIAFDLNWRENPMGTYADNPNSGKKGAIPYATAVALARKYGCEYGGAWSGGNGHKAFKDFMHFEIHLTPAVARTVVATHPSPLNFLEQIMALDRTSADYKAFMADVEAHAAHGVLNAPITSPVNGKSYPLYKYLQTNDARTADLEKRAAEAAASAKRAAK